MVQRGYVDTIHSSTKTRHNTSQQSIILIIITLITITLTTLYVYTNQQIRYVVTIDYSYFGKNYFTPVSNHDGIHSYSLSDAPNRIDEQAFRIYMPTYAKVIEMITITIAIVTK